MRKHFGVTVGHKLRRVTHSIFFERSPITLHASNGPKVWVERRPGCGCDGVVLFPRVQVFPKPHPGKVEVSAQSLRRTGVGSIYQLCEHKSDTICSLRIPRRRWSVREVQMWNPDSVRSAGCLPDPRWHQKRTIALALPLRR